ncbi:hypothetical protein [Sphingobacterium suaedae]|uniref:DUF4468 domain-containing protein n=1 Tax=Sphingobacterium suaedae TaxID=1686402 RepID=A0ABW5KLE6_9SPHI
MKKLLILFILSLGLGTVNAQAKKTVSKSAVAEGQPIASTKEQTPAEAKGPSKEETITYIHNIVKNIKYYNFESAPNINVTTSDNTIYESVVLDGCNLIITSLWERKATTKLGSSQSKGQQIVTVPIDKVEKISTGLNFIKFSYYQGEEAIKTKLKVDEVNYAKSTKVTETYSPDYTIIGNENEEVFNNLAKALNHLRKLCGAPEPISFD